MEGVSKPRARADRTVLVVEDDPDVATMLRTYLELHGYEVTLAGDTDQALARLEQRPARVAVVDAHLPGRSGLELTRELRARDGSPAVLVYTAGMATPAEARAAGADAFLLKTAPLSQLLEEVAALGDPPSPSQGVGRR
jgi:two-component system phosphate regulon response regulator OmpR